MRILTLLLLAACQPEPTTAPVISTSDLTSCVMKEAKQTGSDGCQTASRVIDGHAYQFSNCPDLSSGLNGRLNVVETASSDGFTTFLVGPDGDLLYADCTNTGSAYCGTGDAPTPESNAYWLAQWIERRSLLGTFCQGK